LDSAARVSSTAVGVAGVGVLVWVVGSLIRAARISAVSVGVGVVMSQSLFW
jgi:hypothetical protein